MKTGWTGGQYSIYRALLAIGTASVLVSRLLRTPEFGWALCLLTLGLVGCVALAVGWHDRIASLALVVFGVGTAAFIDAAPLVLPGTDVVVISFLLVLHAATPQDPYGAWSARARPDPGGDWRMPSWIPHSVWGLLAIAYVLTDLERLSGIAFTPAAIDASRFAWFGLLFDSWFVIALFRVESRASAWIAMSLWRVAWAFAFGAFVEPGTSPIESNVWLLHLLAFDPAWIASRATASIESTGAPSTDSRARLFYDGDCGLCHRTVRFLIAEDGHLEDASRLRFAPLGGDAFMQLVANSPEIDPAHLPDSIVLELEDGRVATRATAVIEIANRLGGFWRAIAFAVSLGGFVPNAVLDSAYDVVAENRKRFFEKPKDSCPILPPDLRERFDL
jgi:predicted DCC family thiol-disulfide oxidoreductase YuxK